MFWKKKIHDFSYFWNKRLFFFFFINFKEWCFGFQKEFFFEILIGKIKYSTKRNDISTTFLQQILNGRLLLVVIVGAKK